MIDQERSVCLEVLLAALNDLLGVELAVLLGVVEGF